MLGKRGRGVNVAGPNVLGSGVADDVLEPNVPAALAAEDAEVLQASIKAATVAQIVVAIVAIIGLLYLLQLVLVTILSSMLLAYSLEPLVQVLTRLRAPRWLAALIVVLLACAVTTGITYISYNRVLEFADQLPNYTVGLRQTIARVQSRASQLETQARSIVEAPKEGKAPIAVKVQEPQGLARLLSQNPGPILDAVLAIGFVPFLVYFMLATKDHFHVATVRLFPREHRLLAHRTVGTISAMIRSYISANVLVGLLNGLICALIFWFLGIKYFYFIGAISGFAGLIPYLGIFLSLLAPLAAGIETLNKTGLITLIAAVVVLHIVTMNVIYPKMIGARLSLNPLAVSISLLFWAWIWGALGLVLAIPVLGATKIVCDHVESLRGLGSWLGESLQVASVRLQPEDGSNAGS